MNTNTTKFTSWIKSLRNYTIPIAALLICATISIGLFFKAREYDKKLLQDEFMEESGNRFSALNKELELNLQTVQSLHAFLEHSTVTREEFRLYVESLIRKHKTNLTLEWIPRVLDSERAAYEMKARRDGFHNFRITERAAPGTLVNASRTAEYLPIFFVEPYKGNEIALGYNLASNPSIKEALERYRDSNDMHTCAGLTLGQEPADKHGLMVFSPVHRNRVAADSPSNRRNDPQGYVLGTFSISEILEKSLTYLKPSGIDIFIYAGTTPDKKNLLVYHPSRMRIGKAEPAAARGTKSAKTFEYEKTLDVAGSQWLVLCRSTPYFIVANKTGNAAWVLAGGLTFTFLLTGYLFNSIRRTERVERIVTERTAELQMANEELSHEVACRQQVEQDLGKANQEMEGRVRQRTRDLSMSYSKLVQEIIDRKVAEESLRSSEERFRKIFENGPIGMSMTDLSHGFINVNEMLCTMVGYTNEELTALSYLDITHPEDRDVSMVHSHELLKAEVSCYNCEKRYIKKDGKVLWADETVSLMCNEEGNPLYFIGMVQDITERKKLENQLIQAQKMEAVGQLSGGIAHDFNNLLTPIIGYATLVEMKMDKEDPSLPYLNHILSAAERAAEMTKGLLAFSRKQVFKLQPKDLNSVVRDLEKLLFRLITEDIELKVCLTDQDLIVMADAGQIDQVLMNLAANARDSMPGGGVLTIETGTMELTGDYITAHGYGTEGHYAMLAIRDSGAGMDKTTSARIFEPFFTTKEVGKGTGLGLSIVYGIVKQHNGFINVDSEPGEGTTFTIYLPLETEVPALPRLIESSPPSLHGTETVLVVEDNAEVMALTRIILEEYGYQVIGAQDGQDAVGKFAQNQDTIGLVITDVVMPKMNGKDSVAEMEKIRSGVKVLFTSGYTPDVVKQKGIRIDETNFISKPASPQALLKKIREVLTT